MVKILITGCCCNVKKYDAIGEMKLNRNYILSYMINRPIIALCQAIIADAKNENSSKF